MMKAKNFWICTFMLCLTGCGGESDDPVAPTPDPEPTPTPEVVKPEIKLPAQITSSGIKFTENKASTQSITFTCNDNWTLSIKENRSSSWCVPSATSGSKGEVTITFTVTENTTYDDRSVTITIQCGTATTSFVISQPGIKALFINPQKCELEQLGDTITVDIQSNVDYEVLMPTEAKWIQKTDKARGLSQSQAFFIISKNDNTESRNAQIIFTNKKEQVSDTLHITQKGGSETTIGTGNNVTDWNNGSSSSGSASEQ